jgi:hypothetical protein
MLEAVSELLPKPISEYNYYYIFDNQFFKILKNSFNGKLVLLL